jgi:hypothetical protein
LPQWLQEICQTIEGCNYFTYNAAKEECYLFHYRYLDSCQACINLLQLNYCGAGKFCCGSGSSSESYPLAFITLREKIINKFASRLSKLCVSGTAPAVQSNCLIVLCRDINQFKRVVSRDWGGLQIVSLKRYKVKGLKLL